MIRKFYDRIITETGWIDEGAPDKAIEKYWHEIEQSEVNELVEKGTTIQSILDNYKQPDWCSYPKALSGVFGCWSLTDNTVGGGRTKISKDFCSGCDCCTIK